MRSAECGIESPPVHSAFRIPHSALASSPMPLSEAILGLNAFQIRRDPIQVGFIDDEEWKKIQRRPIIAPEDIPYVERAIPDAQAISLQSGWPTPMADVQWRNRSEE